MLVHIPIWTTDRYMLPGHVRKILFFMLWEMHGRNRTAICWSCGASEGRCSNTYCARTQTTNKMFLYRDWG